MRFRVIRPETKGFSIVDGSGFMITVETEDNRKIVVSLWIIRSQLQSPPIILRFLVAIFSRSADKRRPFQKPLLSGPFFGRPGLHARSIE